nr:MAG TPA: hypothetical protein [Caudoviricetes sp.]DAJ43826.1 MAG TPA: hypothetical protein [Caudoviricetes sp.]
MRAFDSFVSTSTLRPSRCTSVNFLALRSFFF